MNKAEFNNETDSLHLQHSRMTALTSEMKWEHFLLLLIMIKDKLVVEQTHFHTGEIAAVSPSEPATGGALVNVHVLQVHVHTDDTPAREREGQVNFM